MALASSNSATVAITVTAANDAPVGADQTVSISEGATYAFAVSDFGFSDVHDSPANALAAVKISSLPLAGTLLYNGVAITPTQVSNGFEVSAADIASGLLSFQPALGANGAGYASFTFQVRDNGGTGNGGVDLDPTPNTITIDVGQVNNAPAGADKTVSVNEDGTYAFAVSDFGFSDPNDTPSDALAAVKISSLPLAGTLLYNGVAITATQVSNGFEVSAADILAGKLTFQPAANANGTAYSSFTFQVRDNGGTGNGGVDLDPTPNTFTITVTAVNDAPVNTVPGAQSVAEDTNLSLTGLSISDVDAGSATITTTLSVLNGTLTVLSAGGAAVAGSGTGSVTLTGTVAQINTTLAAANNVVYRAWPTSTAATR